MDKLVKTKWLDHYGNKVEIFFNTGNWLPATELEFWKHKYELARKENNRREEVAALEEIDFIEETEMDLELREWGII